MRNIILTAVIVLLSVITITAQTKYHDVDITKYEKQKGFTSMNVEDYGTCYISKSDYYFDDILIVPKSKFITFTKRNFSTMNYIDVYKDIVSIYGKEDLDRSYIPESSKGDLDYTITLVHLDEAKISKLWKEPFYDIMIIASKRELSVTFFKK